MDKEKQAEFRVVTLSDVRVNLGRPDSNDLSQAKYSSYWEVALATYPELGAKSPEELELLRPRYSAIVRSIAERYAGWLTVTLRDMDSAEFTADTKLIRSLHKKRGYVSDADIARIVLKEPFSERNQLSTPTGPVGYDQQSLGDFGSGGKPQVLSALDRDGKPINQ